MPNSIAVSAPKFGAWLKLRRVQKKRTHEELAQDVRPLVKGTGLRVSKSQIVALEKGRVPSWPLLAALCRVYGTDIRDTVLMLIDALEFPGSRDLLRQPVGVELASNPPTKEGGAPDVLSSPRLIAEELSTFADSVASTLQEIADRIAGGLAIEPSPHTSGGPDAHTPDSLSHPRKTG